MKNNELVELLKALDPEMEVVMQQGSDFDYSSVGHVDVSDVVEADNLDSGLTVIVLNF